MAVITWTKGSAMEFLNTPHKAVNSVTENFDMDALVEDAARLMQDMIATRGTGRVWSRPGPTGRAASAPGRIDTGEMWSAVKHRVVYEGDKIVGEFGWLDNQESYFYFQEAGFVHRWAGHVPGMLALQDAGIAAQQEFIRRLSLAVKNRG